jgi:hypothetical protein
VERARRRELAELVADHVLRHEYRHEFAAIVDREREADRFRRDRAPPRPGLDDFLRLRVVMPLTRASATRVLPLIRARRRKTGACARMGEARSKPDASGSVSAALNRLFEGLFFCAAVASTAGREHGCRHPPRTCLPPPGARTLARLMADPTLKDVLKAFARLESSQARLESGLADVRREMANKTDLAEVREEVSELRAEVSDLQADVKQRFDRVDRQLAELDRNLDGHMKVHRELERDVEALKGRPPRTAARVRRGTRKPSTR